MKHSGIQFLDHLDPSKDSSFNLETYTDIPKGAERMKPDPLFNRWPNLTRLEVEQLIPNVRDNAAKRIFYVLGASTLT